MGFFFLKKSNIESLRALKQSEIQNMQLRTAEQKQHTKIHNKMHYPLQLLQFYCSKHFCSVTHYFTCFPKKCKTLAQFTHSMPFTGSLYYLIVPLYFSQSLLKFSNLFSKVFISILSFTQQLSKICLEKEQISEVSVCGEKCKQCLKRNT